MAKWRSRSKVQEEQEGEDEGEEEEEQQQFSNFKDRRVTSRSKTAHFAKRTDKEPFTKLAHTRISLVSKYISFSVLFFDNYECNLKNDCCSKMHFLVMKKHHCEGRGRMWIHVIIFCVSDFFKRWAIVKSVLWLSYNEGQNFSSTQKHTIKHHR